MSETLVRIHIQYLFYLSGSDIYLVMYVSGSKELNKFGSGFVSYPGFAVSQLQNDFFPLCLIYGQGHGYRYICRKNLFVTLEIRFTGMCTGCDLLSSSVVDPHWFHCGSDSVSIILG